MTLNAPAEYFGVVLDRVTGKVNRVFNPENDWEFAIHHVGKGEEMRLERKDDWGVPKVPNAMTLEMVWNIQRTFETRRNYRPGDE